jgi:hypothetical protein
MLNGERKLFAVVRGAIHFNWDGKLSMVQFERDRPRLAPVALFTTYSQAVARVVELAERAEESGLGRTEKQLAKLLEDCDVTYRGPVPVYHLNLSTPVPPFAYIDSLYRFYSIIELPFED